MNKSDIAVGLKYRNSAGSIVEVITIHNSGYRAEVRSDSWKHTYHNDVTGILDCFKKGYYHLTHTGKPLLYEIY